MTGQCGWFSFTPSPSGQGEPAPELGSPEQFLTPDSWSEPFPPAWPALSTLEAFSSSWSIPSQGQAVAGEPWQHRSHSRQRESQFDPQFPAQLRAETRPQH